MRASFLVMLVLLTACRWHGMEHPPLGGRGGGGITASDSSSGKAALSDKTVNSKVEPRTLVATDGTRCVVTDARFRDTMVGEKVWCVWQ